MASSKKTADVRPTEQLPEIHKDQLPSTEVVSDADLKEMYGDLSREHVSIPRFVITEGTSPEFKESLSKIGHFFVKGLNVDLGANPLEVVVIMRAHSRMRWRDIKDGGGIVCQALDGKKGVGDPGGECLKCNLKEWGTFEGKSVKPQCDLYENFVIVERSALQAGEPTPMAISGSRTRLKGLKDFNTLLMQSLQLGRPLYCKSYLIKPVKRSKGINEWHVFQVSVGNQNQQLPKEEQVLAYQLFKSFSGRGIVIDQDNPADEQVAPSAPEGAPAI